MNVAPSTSFEARADGFPTGLTGTLGVRILDNIGGTTLARLTAGITENPAGSGSYIVTLTSPSTAGQYSLFWDTGVVSPSTTASEDLLITSTSAAPVGAPGDTYASVSELARILKIRTPTDEQEASMERVLLTATGEIDAEIDRDDDEDPISGWMLALAEEVCLERAVEHWRQQESPFGLIGLGAELPAERTARDSWERHAHKLAPLKSQWGFS